MSILTGEPAMIGVVLSNSHFDWLCGVTDIVSVSGVGVEDIENGRHNNNGITHYYNGKGHQWQPF